MCRLLWLGLSLIALVEARHWRYEGHHLFRVTGSQEHIRQLDQELDLWGVRLATGASEAVLRLAPAEESQWLRTFEERELRYELINDNVAGLFREEDALLERSREKVRAVGRNYTWQTYPRHDEVNAYVDALAAAHPDLVTVTNVSLSTEGRQIKYVRISTTNFQDARKPVIVIDAAIHAREWVTVPVALYLMHQLVVARVDEDLVNRLDWLIIPVANPDGYEYTFTDDRLWRKTRSKLHAGWEAHDNCVGIDGNRNYDFAFATVEANADPCTIVYEGPTPFSEPETAVVRDAVLAHLERTQLYISLHSYGNLFLYSWGNNGTVPENGEALHEAGVTMAEAIERLALEESTRYVVGNSAQVLYYTTGTSRDWARYVGVPLSYTLELPGFSYYFQVPPEYIEQINTETWAGLAAGGHYVLANNAVGVTATYTAPCVLAILLLINTYLMS